MLSPDALNLITIANELISRFRAKEAAAKAAADSVEKLASPIADALIGRGFSDPGRRDSLVKALGDPVKTAQLLLTFAKQAAPAGPAAIGRPEPTQPEKRAHVIGGKTTEKRASDLKWEQGAAALGIPVQG
jgi:hypothetical protein